MHAKLLAQGPAHKHSKPWLLLVGCWSPRHDVGRAGGGLGSQEGPTATASEDLHLGLAPEKARAEGKARL